MGVGTLLGFLIGDRMAILTLAGHRRAWIIGLVFVLSAGLAREYDNEDLLHEPWYLLLPLGASFVSSFVLYCVLYGIGALWRGDGPSFLAAYLGFLNLFWMTAPLAWLYAIPYERMMDPVSATGANLCTLAIVSIWRVALMMRVAVVLMGMGPWSAIFRVMAYADGVALTVLYFLPFPIIEIMGGAHLPGAEGMVRGAAQNVLCFGGGSFLIWVIAAAICASKTCWQVRPDQAANPAIRWPLRILALASLAIWPAILPFTQPEQQLRRRVECAFRQGRHADGLAEMSFHTLSDFPPHWEPPPRFLQGDRMDMILDVWEAIIQDPPASWVRERYMKKLTDYIAQGPWRFNEENFANLLNRLPEGESLLRDMELHPRWKWNIERLEPYLRPELREKLKKDDK